MHIFTFGAGYAYRYPRTRVPCSRSLRPRYLPGFSLFRGGGYLPISDFVLKEKTGTNAPPHLPGTNPKQIRYKSGTNPNAVLIQKMGPGGGSFPPLSYFAFFL